MGRLKSTLTKATAMYREMEMAYWLQQAAAELERLPCDGIYEVLIEMRALMRTDRASSDQVDGAFKRVMPLPF